MSCCVLPVKLRMSGQLRVTVTGLIRTLFLFLLSVIPSHFLSAEYPRQPHTTSLSFLAHRPSDGCYPASPLPLAWNHLGLISAQHVGLQTSQGQNPKGRVVCSGIRELGLHPGKYILEPVISPQLPEGKKNMLMKLCHRPLSACEDCRGVTRHSA